MNPKLVIKEFNNFRNNKAIRNIMILNKKMNNKVKLNQKKVR